MQVSVVSRRSVERAAGARSTNSLRAQERERPGRNPVFQNIGAVSAEQMPVTHILPERWTDPKPGSRVCAVHCRLSVVASADLRRRWRWHS